MSVWLSRRLLLLLLRRITAGRLIVVEGNERLVFGSGAPTATVQIVSSRTWRMLLRGSRGMAEAFAQGLWDSPDLVVLIRLAARNAGGLDRLRSRLSPLRRPLRRAGALVRFPGGCLPSLEMITRNVARQTDLQAIGLEDITPHYVETLRRWRQNFTAHADELAERGYDERFRRLWTLYLIYCEAGFAERRICNVQLLLTKPRSRITSRTYRTGSGHSHHRNLSLSA